MKVGIIGCGYVGTAAARHWQANPDMGVVATTTTRDRVAELEAIASQVVRVRGNDPQGLQSVLQDCDLVLLTVGAKRGEGYEEVYLQTAQTLVSLLPQNPNLRQIIYTSSYAVYGRQTEEWVDEESPCNLGDRKLEILYQTEQTLLKAASEAVRVCVLRLGGIYGPGRELSKIYGRLAGKTLPGNGKEPSNWIHLEDIVGAIDFARQQGLQGIYNLVDDASLSRKDLISQVLTAENLPPVSWDASQPSPQSYRARVSNQKIKAAGYQLLHPQRRF